MDEQFEEDKQLFIDRVTFFPLMAFELTDDVTPEFLFWDRDFLMIEDFGIENYDDLKNFLSDTIDFGFSTVDENTQMYTGSQRYDI